MAGTRGGIGSSAAGVGALPIVDVSPFVGSGTSSSSSARAEAVDSVREALEHSGFLVVSGHGVPVSVVAAAHGAYRAFYALPREQKLSVAGNFMQTDAEGKLRHAPRGYSPGAGDPFAREAFAVQKEDWDPADLFFGSTAAAPWVGATPAEQNLWPVETHPTGFRKAIMVYYREMERLAVVLEQILAEALGLPPAYFVERANRSITNMVGFSFVPQKIGVAVPAHDDEGDFTILSHDPLYEGSSGLELQLPEDNPWMATESADQRVRNRKLDLQYQQLSARDAVASTQPEVKQPDDGERVWRPVEPVPGCFIINTGNLMHRFSGGKFQSTMHRVRVTALHSVPRQSIAFFHTPNADAVVAPVRTDGTGGDRVAEKFEPTTSGVLVLERLKMLLPGYGSVEGGDQQRNWEAYLEKNGLRKTVTVPKL
jgi:isopenicillin N synthase-like dioxygenase